MQYFVYFTVPFVKMFYWLAENQYGYKYIMQIFDSVSILKNMNYGGDQQAWHYVILSCRVYYNKELKEYKLLNIFSFRELKEGTITLPVKIIIIIVIIIPFSFSKMIRVMANTLLCCLLAFMFLQTTDIMNSREGTKRQKRKTEVSTELTTTTTKIHTSLLTMVKEYDNWKGIQSSSKRYDHQCSPTLKV